MWQYQHSVETIAAPEADGLTRIVYRAEITGPAADSIGTGLGPRITTDFPDVLTALAKLTEG
jgi:hypothetical protein